MALTETTDINGKLLEPGCRVRCHYGARYDDANDWLIGIDTMGRCSYIEGELMAIEDRPEGRYYRIGIYRSVSPIVIRTRSDFEFTDDLQTTRYADGRSFPVFIPVNSPTSFCVIRL